jgi:alpha-ketoglutarate-dependent taurine dioxygenase
MDFSALKEKGWMIVDGISSASELLELGKEIGNPVLAPNGELVKEIRHIPKENALPESQSSIYGSGPFPLHTDTVFWPLPIRFVLFRASGDVRRPTTVKQIGDLLQKVDKTFISLCDRTVWYVGPRTKRFYCSLRFRNGDLTGWRYDADLMTPANHAANEVEKILRPLAFQKTTDQITWSGNNAAIISNWDILHGRGSQPSNEGERIIERLYVR